MHPVLQDIERYCKIHDLPAVPKSEGEFLSLMVQLVKPKIIVEVGTLVGYSTLWMALADSATKILTFERDEKNAEIAKKNFDAAKVSNITIILGNAKEKLSTVQIPVDFVFLDAQKNEYLDYYHALLPHLHPGTVIIADNIFTFPEKLKPYVEFMREHHKSMVIPFVNGVELTVI